MAQKRFGPTLAAGTAVIEGETDKPITPATLGVTVMTGIMEKGPTDRLFRAANRTEFLKQAGSYSSDSQLPNAAFDFYNFSTGAGELWLSRITDGTGKLASASLKSRLTPHGEVLKIESKNVGRWGGKAQCIVADYVGVTQTTFDTGKTMLKNEFKDATLTLSAVVNKSYKVISNDVAGVLTLASDVTLVTDISGSGDLLYKLELTNGEKKVGVLIKNGLENPTTEFGMEIYLDGVFQREYPNLSMEPNSTRYVEQVINDDGSNTWITVTDLNTGSVVAGTRPANFHGVSTGLTATVLTADIHEASTSAAGDTVGVVGALTLGSDVKKDTLTLTVTNDATPTAAVFSVVSSVQGALAALTEGVAYTTNKYLADFTLTNSGGDNYANGDVVTITFDPFPNLAGATLVPDSVNDRRSKFAIASNTANTITVKVGNDMTTVAAISDEYIVEYASQLGGGYDGVEDVADATYIAAYDTGTSYINQLFGKKKGLVKLSTPGITSTLVQKAGKDYAEAKNYMYRAEIPANVTTDDGAEAYVNDTIGKSNYAKFHFPSYAYVSNPLGAGRILQTMSGAFLGREAKVAKDFAGFHKAAGGEDVTLPHIVDLPTGERALDEELLNPNGINVVKKLDGNYVMWGDRLPAVDSAFKFAHTRETLSHWENIFRESFNYIIFSIPNAEQRELLKASFRAFFSLEFTKSAIIGRNLDDAVLIKIDDENNPPAAVAAGDTNAEIRPRIVGVTERFVITMTPAGIFEDFSA